MTIKHQQLKHVLALAKYGNFREAAENQHISQPAFSRSIHNLEESLGVKLFDRTSRGARLTMFGEAILKRATKVVDEASEITREIRLLQGLDVGSFTVAMAHIPAELSASRALGEMVKRYPEMKYRARLSDWEGVAGQVISRAVDIGIGEISEAEQDERLQVDLVGEHPIVLFHRKGHPLSEKKSLRKSDIDKFNLALIKLPQRLADRFPGKGYIDPHSGYKIPSIEVDDFTIARNIVLGSNTISASMILQIEPLLKSGEVEVMPYRAPWLKTRYGFVYRRDRMLSPAARAFINAVTQVEFDVAARNEALMKRFFPS